MGWTIWNCVYWDQDNGIYVPPRETLGMFGWRDAINALKPYSCPSISSKTQGQIVGVRESLRPMLSRPFRLSLAPTICPWVSDDVLGQD